MDDRTETPLENRTGPLKGITVLDLSAVVLGPLATQNLGDLGAEIIKVEGLSGDHSRSRGVCLHANMATVFLAVNRNKKSIAVDLKTQSGREILYRLAEKADILIHNMRIPAINRLGLGYDKIQSLNKKIIYCAATAFDQDGPDRDKPAFDDIIQSASGLVDLNFRQTGSLDYVPTLVADKAAGMAVTNAVLAALFHRERTGEGQYIEVPMFESIVSFLLVEHLAGKTYVKEDLKAGYSRLLTGGRQPLKTKDGNLTVLPYTATHWKKLFDATGRSELTERYCVEDRQARSDNIPALYKSLSDIAAARTNDELIALCEKLDIPYSRIYSIDDLTEHPQLKGSRLFETIEVKGVGEIRYVKPTSKFDKTPTDVRLPPPALGEHTIEILKFAGFEKDSITKFVNDQIVKQN